MKRTSVAALLCLTAAACLTAPPRPRFPTAAFELPRQVRVQFVEQGVKVIRDIPLEDYVRAAALSEFAPAAGDLETVEKMLEVQAIISRTYAVSHGARHASEGFDLCATTHCQLFEPARLQTSRWSGAAAQAVEATAGVVLRFNGGTAQALYHADCGGHTSTASAVWGGDDRAYLRSRTDDGVPEDTHAAWEFRVASERITSALNVDVRTKGGGEIDRIDVIHRDEAGRVQRVAIGRAPAASTSASRVPGSAMIRGDELRQILSRAFGPRAIRSTWFDVRRDGRSFVFSGRGYGHGVGLCQAGALARLRAGATPNAVIEFYYPGTSLQTAQRREP